MLTRRFLDFGAGVGALCAHGRAAVEAGVAGDLAHGLGVLAVDGLGLGGEGGDVDGPLPAVGHGVEAERVLGHQAASSTAVDFSTAMISLAYSAAFCLATARPPT